MEAHAISFDATPDPSPRMEHELDLIRGAIALVLSGEAPRVTLVNLSASDGIVRAATDLAVSAGLLLTASRRADVNEITVEAPE